MDIYYLNGEFVNDEDSRIPARDIIVLRGFGIFDFMITYNKRPFYLRSHVERFENSAKEIGLKLNHTNEEICDIVRMTVGKNPHHDESNIRIVHTGGVSSDCVTPQGNGILMVMVTPKYKLPDWWYTNGASVVTVYIERFMPTAKSTNYLTAVFAQQEAHKKGAVEAIYVDRNNRVLEGTTTNIFCFKGSTLITPPDTMLPGITRGVILNLIKELNRDFSKGLAKDTFSLEMRHIEMSELENMDEIFISASNKEIVPIIKVNDMVVGSGKPGEHTQKIMGLFRDYTTAYGKGEVG